MDLHEQRQLEVAKQVAKVKARTRPWRAIIALALAVAAGAVASLAGSGFEDWTGHGHVGNKLVTAVTAILFCVLALVASLALAGRTRQALQPVAGSAHAAVVRYSIVLIGTVLTVVIGLALFKVPVGQLIVGGALTTILIGIAAQQSLGNIFAGLVLLLSRPFNVGDSIQLRSGAMGGLIEGMVTEVGITYMRLDTADGPMSLPNSQVLAAAVGRRNPAGNKTRPDAPNGQHATTATPADALTAPPGGQQATPADLTLAAPESHPVPAQDPRSPEDPSPRS